MPSLGYSVLVISIAGRKRNHHVKRGSRRLMTIGIMTIGIMTMTNNLMTRDEALAVLCSIANNEKMSGSYRVQAIRAYLTFTDSSNTNNSGSASEILDALTED